MVEVEVKETDPSAEEDSNQGSSSDENDYKSNNQNARPVTN